MKQFVWIKTLLLLTLLSCGTTTSSNSLISENQSSLETVSTTSLISSELTSLSSEDVMPTLTTKWATLLGIPEANYTETPLELTNEFTSVDIIEVAAIYSRNDATFYGLVYEANVLGNGGRIRFRIGIVDQMFAGFNVVTHSEHTSFGMKIIHALNTGLVGQPATYEAAVNVLITKNVSVTNITETYSAMYPAIEAMANHAMQFQA
jgi:Na+-translocating ferredoxin:NAD+ oxidoreductase RnfG subunit